MIEPGGMGGGGVGDQDVSIWIAIPSVGTNFICLVWNTMNKTNLFVGQMEWEWSFFSSFETEVKF